MRSHTFLCILILVVFITALTAFIVSHRNKMLIDQLIRVQTQTTSTVLSLSENQIIIIDELTE